MLRTDRKPIAFVVYPGVTPLDLVGPLSVLRDLRIGSPYRTVVVGERLEPMVTDTALQLIPAKTFPEVPAPFAIFVPGGGAATFDAMNDLSMLGYLRSAAETAEIVGSTGNGALILAAAGLLHERQAAIQRGYAAHLERLGVRASPERWVDDGTVLTAAGGSAGIDMMLHLVARLRGESRARMTQVFVEYDPQPPFGGIDWATVEADPGTIHGAEGQQVGRAAAEQDERTIAVVLYPGLTALDFVGPLQVLTALERFAPRYRTVTVAERTAPMDTDVHLRMIPDKTFAEVPQPYVLVVPGGRRATLRAMSDPVMREYVRTAAGAAEIVASVCTGSLILAAVGLLENRRATTNWFYHRVLERLGATCLPRRWVEDGRFLTSGGVSAGIDMALYLVSRLTGETTARRVQAAIDYDPQPPFGPIDWENVGRLPRLMRGGISLAAPAIVARPRRLTRAERGGPGGPGPAEERST